MCVNVSLCACVSGFGVSDLGLRLGFDICALVCVDVRVYIRVWGLGFSFRVTVRL